MFQGREKEKMKHRSMYKFLKLLDANMKGFMLPDANLVPVATVTEFCSFKLTGFYFVMNVNSATDGTLSDVLNGLI